MNALKKKAAVSKYAAALLEGATRADILEALAADPKGYTAEEKDEIMIGVDEAIAAPASKAASATNNAAASTTASPYKEYELWRVDVERLTNGATTDRDLKIIGYRYTAVKLVKEKGVTQLLEESTVAILNSQSHNSGRRLYIAGTVINGAEETVDDQNRQLNK